MHRLSPSASGAIRSFSFWSANGTMSLPILEGIDYRQILLTEPSALERVYAIFANVLEFDEEERVVNAKHAERRAAQWLRGYIEPTYKIEPPLADWEIALH
jgi:hypothetical protein